MQFWRAAANDSQSTGKNLKETFLRISQATRSGMGLFVTLIHATLFEVIENSQAIIELFRENTGLKPVGHDAF